MARAILTTAALLVPSVVAFDAAKVQALPFANGVGIGRPATSVDALKALGGNWIRVWGVDGLSNELVASCERNGVSINVGLWIDNPYVDVGAAAATAVSQVNTWKHSPAIKVWSVGNELDVRGDLGTAMRLINAVSRAVKVADPSRPTSTAFAEVGDNKASMFKQLCPDVDILGINTYGGAPWLGDKLVAQGYTGPFWLTEYGLAGHWAGDTTMTAWGAPIEPPSTAKASFSVDAYKSTVARFASTSIPAGQWASRPVCIGSFAFTYASKLEATETFYSMIVGGSPVMDRLTVLSALWRGSGLPGSTSTASLSAWLAGQGVPSTTGITFADGSGVATVPRGGSVRATAGLPGGSWTVDWAIKAEEGINVPYGGDMATQLASIVQQLRGGPAATLTVPATPGAYRIYAYVRNAGDAGRGVATASAPIMVT